MRSREQLIEEMTSGFSGMDRAEAERRLLDDDLWLLDPEMRFAFEGEEAVAQWEQTAKLAGALAEGFSGLDPGVNETTRQLIWDMAERANEALRRSRARARAH